VIVECKIDSNGDIDIKNLLPKQYWAGKHYLAKFDVPKPEFFTRCRFQTYFVPKSLAIGDEVFCGIAKTPESKKHFIVIEKTENKIVFKQLGEGDEPRQD